MHVSEATKLVTAKLILGASLAIGLHEAGWAMATADQAPETCQEDQACWDCTTMGNMECGPEAGQELTWEGQVVLTDEYMKVDCSFPEAEQVDSCQAYWEQGAYIGGYN